MTIELYTIGTLHIPGAVEPTPPVGDRGVWSGGKATSNPTDLIQYVTISSIGNASDFGDLVTARQDCVGTSNGFSQRGVCMGGYNVGFKNAEYFTINSPSNATDSLYMGRRYAAACSNDTNDRGIYAGGEPTVGYPASSITYVTISTMASVTAFGSLLQDKRKGSGADNATNERGLFAGGDSYSDSIEYITINSTGNSIDFGDLTKGRYYMASCSNATNERGIWAGDPGDNSIDYSTINSLGNASDFGDLLNTNSNSAGTSNGTNERGVIAGGSGESNIIQYITINSLGNAADFGDMVGGLYALASCSNA